MSGVTVVRKFHIHRGYKQSREIRKGDAPKPPSLRTPRITKLMALAIRFDKILRTGQVKDYATLARYGQVTRARMTQIMNLLLLAPDIQEELLYLPKSPKGRDQFPLKNIQPVALELNWGKQREMWVELKQNA